MWIRNERTQGQQNNHLLKCQKKIQNQTRVAKPQQERHSGGVKDKRSLQKGRFIIYFKRVSYRDKGLFCSLYWMNVMGPTHFHAPHMNPITCLNAWTWWAQFDNTFLRGVHLHLYFTFPDIPFNLPTLHYLVEGLVSSNSFCLQSLPFSNKATLVGHILSSTLRGL